MSITSSSFGTIPKSLSGSFDSFPGLKYCSPCHEVFSKAMAHQNELSLFCHALQARKSHYDCALSWLEHSFTEALAEEFTSQPAQTAAREMNEIKKAVHGTALNALKIITTLASPNPREEIRKVVQVAADSINSALLQIQTSTKKIHTQLEIDPTIPGGKDALEALHCVLETLKDGASYATTIQKLLDPSKMLLHDLAIATIGSVALLTLADQTSDD